MSSSGPSSERTPTPSDFGSPIGVIGGSGLCAFPEVTVIERIRPYTRYGESSADLLLVEHDRHPFVFLPRHGETHAIPPHRVPYKANLAALKAVGVRAVIGTCIAGSLQEHIKPGEFVVPDQFVNMTWGRDDAGEIGNFLHLPMAHPYCEHLRREAITALERANITPHREGTVAVIQGPRFSTVAESQWFARNGWDVVNMTQYPECYFAREFGLCYAAIAAVTDYDVGLSSSLSMKPENMDRILDIFRRNVRITKEVIFSLADRLQSFECGCAAKTTAEYYKQR